MNLILKGFLLRIASEAAVEFVSARCHAFVINFKLLAAILRTEVHVLGVLGGPLFEADLSRKAVPGPMSLEIDSGTPVDSRTEFLPISVEQHLDNKG